MTETGSLTQLGSNISLPESPDAAVLEKVANPQRDSRHVVRFTCPEFTSICPVTGQPDFAHLVIDYLPGDFIVDSKSLKLYLGAFRNQGAFHEDCTVAIAIGLAFIGYTVLIAVIAETTLNINGILNTISVTVHNASNKDIRST